MKRHITFLIVLLLIASVKARIITVDDDGPADFNSIQAAIDDSNHGDIVLVSRGSYLVPCQNDAIDFNGRNITLTSLDPMDSDIVAGTIIHGVVQFDGTEEPNCTLTGFTIQDLCYGAIYGNHTQATISHCVLNGNGPCYATVIKDCHGTISNCLITDNFTVWLCGVHPVIEGCHGFINNCTIAGNDSGVGLEENGSATMQNCIVYGNHSKYQISVALGANLDIAYCSVQGGLGGIQNNGTVQWLGGNIDTDPCFAEPGGSCIDIEYPVDDMESYDRTGNLIYYTWLESGGALIDLGVHPNNPVFDGNQAMWYSYDNTFDWDSVYLSEVEKALYDPCHWIPRSPEASLRLYFYGDSENSTSEADRLYVGIEDNSANFAAVQYGELGEDINDIRIDQWHQWDIPLQLFSDRGVNLSHVRSVCIGFGNRSNPVVPGGSGVVYFDEIKLMHQGIFVPGDYHLQSAAGRWNTNSQTWIPDANTSLCIDAGNPGCPVGDEPDPNGNRINMGAYGGTAEASKSPPGWALLSDMTNDRTTDFGDLRVLVDFWLESGNCLPGDLDRSGFVGPIDYSIFANEFGQTASTSADLNYSIGSCQDEVYQTDFIPTLPPFSIRVEGRYIYFEDIMYANCCPDELGLEMERNGSQITLTEIAPGGMCDCMCYFPVSATIGPLEDGTYIIHVYDNYGQWRGSAEVTIDGSSQSIVNYHVSNCDMSVSALEDEPNNSTDFTITVDGRYIHFEDMMVANCCPDKLEVEITVDGSLITITEIETTTSPCRCMCDFPVTATFGPLADGTYSIEVIDNYGQLAGTVQITIGT